MKGTFAFLILIIFISCRKDNEIDLPEPPVVVCDFEVQTSSFNSLVFGDTTNVRIVEIEDTITISTNNNTSIFGTWCSTENDIKIVEQVYLGPQLSGTTDLWIYNLVDVAFAQIVEGDTTYFYEDTSYSQSQGMTYETITHHYTCDGSESSHDVVTNISDKTALFKNGEELFFTDKFSDQHDAFYKGAIQFYSSGPDTVSVDTIRGYFTSDKRRSCEELYQTGYWYLGFKKPVDVYEKLGWIKFSWEQEGFIIHEVAIQK
ncbi:MAG: hypothetical protein R2780_12235 [Crocinitomicaceae bacterium]|nr:hypothetical protein [Crocinitomicaceae bacterium]